jgi:hypothetical protein
MQHYKNYPIDVTGVARQKWRWFVPPDAIH